MYETLLLLAYSVNVSPDPEGLPGSELLEELVSALLLFGIIACAAGILIGAAMRVVGTRIGNYHYAARGKIMAVYSMGAAVVIAAALMIEFP